MNISMPHWQTIFEMFTILVCSVALLSLISLPIMVLFGQNLSLIRKRSAYEKCAKQLSLLTCILGWFMNVVVLWPLWQRISPHIHEQISQANQADATSQIFDFTHVWAYFTNTIPLQAVTFVWASLFFATLIISYYHSNWSHWKDYRLTHQCATIFAACWYAFTLYAIICIFYAEKNLVLGIAYPQSATELFSPNFEASIWNSIPFLPALAFALGGGLAAVWLIIRRHKDDYGRDYYANMLPWCASWARNAWFLVWFLLVGITAVGWIGLLQEGNYLQNPEFLRSALLLMLWVIPGILWTLCLKSNTPLRHKGTLILAFFLAMAFIIPLYTGLAG